MKADGFRSSSPKAEEKIRLYFYAVSMDGIRYRVTLRGPLERPDTLAHLLRMREEDFFCVSREGRRVEPATFISAYARFFELAKSGPPHTLRIFNSAASL